MWGNEPEPCVFLSLWFSSQSPSAPPQLQENITRSAREEQVCLFLTVLMNKAWAWDQFSWVGTSVWIWGGCETDWFRLLAFRSLCGFRPAFSFLALSLPLGVFWLVATTWASLLLQLNLIHTKKVKPYYEGPNMATKKHFLNEDKQKTVPWAAWTWWFTNI